MARFLKSNKKSSGQSPGSLIFMGSQKMDSVNIRVIDYTPSEVVDLDLATIGEGARFAETDTVTWMNVNGLHNVDLIGEIGQVFNIHPLILEDILNTDQRPKIEDYGSHIFIVLKMIRFDKDKEMIRSEQLSLVLCGNYLLTFQERPGDVFAPVRERIKRPKSRLRGFGTDYLAYALMDTVVDHYIQNIELLGEGIEALEEDILEGDDTGIMGKIHLFKKEMNFLSRSIRPAKEAVFQMTRFDTDLIRDATHPFLKDLQDHINQAAESVDIYRVLLTDQLNLYNSVIANKMNDIMKILTIFASIFIPLTFIAGIYGTNFEYLPEIHYRYSYFIFWGVLLVLAGALLLYFRRKKWF